jgi:hypothetical protein
MENGPCIRVISITPDYLLGDGELLGSLDLAGAAMEPPRKTR